MTTGLPWEDFGVENEIKSLFGRVRATQLGDYVNGTIAALVTIGGLSLGNEREPIEEMSIILAGAVAMWLAKTMSLLIGDQAKQGEPFRYRDVGRQLVRTWPMVSAAVPAVVAMGLAAAGVWSSSIGLDVGLWCGIAGLLVVSIGTARVSERGLWDQTRYVVMVTSAGLVIVVVVLVAKNL
jgi:hypothetical protein